MELKDIIKNARAKLNVEQLTPMQSKMADLSRDARSVTLIAPTGSGKTLAFALPLLTHTSPSAAGIRSVVLAPARELALQITKVLAAIAPGLRIAALYGGHSMLEEKRSLQACTPDIVVATPGRLLDHLQRRNLDLRTVRNLVLDEYDKSLELGFSDEMRRLVAAMRNVRLMILTSATRLGEMPEFIDVRNNREFDFSSDAVAPDLEFFNVTSPEADKLPALKQLLLRLPHERTMVFVNHRESAERVHQYLRKAGFPVILYHGALDQQQRETAVDLFANGTCPVMVATDLAARGLDIPAVASVVHYHLPVGAETLTHRNGRAARMGATGSVYYLIGPSDQPVAGVSAWDPDSASSPEPWRPSLSTLFFHAGKKEKLSKGDIVGALTKVCGLQGNRIGTIALHDHRALVAIPAADSDSVIEKLSKNKIKGHKIRVSKAGNTF
ncbi:MAG: DEAD/DEAH box helicase [Muribaculaceae bacterium]|nr:DEAD/DEAH box helicase [Muribaculaceae bacterium]